MVQAVCPLLRRMGWQRAVLGLTPTVGGRVGQGSVMVDLMVPLGRAARSNAMFSVEKTRVEITWCHRIIMMINSFKARVIVFVQTIEDVGGELIITERLSNGGESIRQTFGLVEEI
jgi:hypothetical protein